MNKRILPLPSAQFHSAAQVDSQVRSSRLFWRQRQLLVRRVADLQQPDLPVLDDSGGITRCLSRSPVKLVKLDVGLGEDQLTDWANACQEAGKPAFLQLRSTADLPHKQHPVRWWLKRAFDWILGVILLVLLSPLLLLLALLVYLSSPGPIFFYQWRVGERGRLFQIIKFRSMVMDAEQSHHQLMGDQKGLHKLKSDPRTTALGRWMRHYSLDELPQLINVVRGEMSLVGPRPWALYDAVRIQAELQPRLNALPGITGAWQVQRRSTLLDLNLVNRGDLKYLQTWSLQQDLKFLLMTIPKVISGSGAY